MQTKLLRVLQTKSFERVGSSHADHRRRPDRRRDPPRPAGDDPRRPVPRGPILPTQRHQHRRTPSLRERREDIFELALTFLRRYAERSGKAIAQLDDEAIEALTAHDWPGNVRELENVIERAVVLAEGPAITRSDLPPELSSAPPAAGPGSPRRRPAAAGPPATAPAGRAIEPPAVAPLDPEAEAFERHQLRDALAEARGNKSEAARLLGLPRSTLVSKLKKYDLMDADPSPDDDRGRPNGSDAERPDQASTPVYSASIGSPVTRRIGRLRRS